MSRTLRRGAVLPLITNGGHHPCIMLTDIYEIIGEGAVGGADAGSAARRGEGWTESRLNPARGGEGVDREQGKGELSIIQVHLTSSKDRSKYDPTCILKSGDDPLITKDCWVYYLRAQVREVADIEAEMIKRDLKVRMISPEIYKLIIQGLLASPATPREVKKDFLDARRLGLAG